MISTVDPTKVGQGKVNLAKVGQGISCALASDLDDTQIDLLEPLPGGLTILVWGTESGVSLPEPGK